MSKKLIAAAIAAAIAPAAAMADASNVTIYGLIDYGFAHRGGDDGAGSRAGRGGSLNEFQGGISAGNRIGFKGSEDLGNGLKAIFEIEWGFSDSQANGGSSNGPVTFNRHTWVGLTGSWGTVLGGRLDGARYSFTGKYDPFKNQTVANAASVFGRTSNLGQGDRADNAVLYLSPDFSGFKFLAAYTKSLLNAEGHGTPALGLAPAAANSGNNIKQGDTPLYAVAMMYDQGPISFTLDYENLEVKGVDAHKADEFDIWVTGGSYDFGMVKLSAYYENTRGESGGLLGAGNRIKGDGWLLGATVPVTQAITLMGSYVRGKDKTTGVDDGECKKYGLGGEYAFSKRTALYATFARLSNDSDMNCGITLSGRTNAGSTAQVPNGNVSATTLPVPTNDKGTGSYGRSGFNIGIRHSF